MNIWKIGADGSGLRQVTAGAGDDAELDISADGKRIVFSTLRENIGLAQLDLQAKPGQQSVKLLTTDPARNQFGPSYSPDGKRLAYFTNFKGAENEAIWVADADGSNAVQLVRDERGSIFPAWTPDGKYLVYTSFVASAGKGEYRSTPISGGVPQTLTQAGFGTADVGRDGWLLFLGAKGQVEAFDPGDRKTRTLGTLPLAEKSPLPPRWSPDQHSIAYMVLPSKDDDSNAGLWVDDFKSPPRQIFRGWILWFARSPGNEIYLLEGKPDLSAVLWKVGWNGQGLARITASIPLLYNLNYQRTIPFNLFDAAPDGRHLAIQTQQVLEEHIGMIENIR